MSIIARLPLALSMPSVSQCLLAAFAIFVVSLVRHRLLWRRRRYPGPPHSFLFGHLLLLRRYRKRYRDRPRSTNGTVALDITKEYGRVVWIDLWPMRSVCLVADPEVASTILKFDNAPKATHMMSHIIPVIGKSSVLFAESTRDGMAHWKIIRKGTAQGLRKGRLEADCMPDIIAGASSFIDAVDARCADGESFLAFPYAANATIDIILKLTLGESSEALRKRIQAILRKQEVYAASASRLMPSRDRLNPIRRLRERQLNREMDDHYRTTIQKHLDQALLCKDKPTKTFLDFLLSEAILTFDDVAAQVKTLIFAGHHTTASALSWALYHVAIEPNLAQRLRQEVHEVLGCDANEDILPAISRQPQLLRDLKLLDAVVKESLRLHPPGSSARQPARDYLIRTEHGSFPLGPAFAWIVHYAMHLHPDNWDDPESFRPERWLDADANAAWQPFSLGPKNCVGADLALMEQRIILAAVVCRYDLTYAASQAPYLKGGLTAVPNNKVPLLAKRRRVSEVA